MKQLMKERKTHNDRSKETNNESESKREINKEGERTKEKQMKELFFKKVTNNEERERERWGREI